MYGYRVRVIYLSLRYKQHFDDILLYSAGALLIYDYFGEVVMYV